MSASPLSALPLPAHDPIWGLCGPFLALLVVVRAIAYRYRVYRPPRSAAVPRSAIAAQY